MKELHELHTLREVDALIDEIGRHLWFDLQARAKSRQWSPEERTVNPKLDAMLKALERRAELETEIKTGLRSPTGELDVRV